MTARFWILQSVGAVLFVAAWFMGWPQYLFNGDSTFMTHGIFVLALVGIAFVGARRYPAAEWIADTLVLLGLIGTVLGFIMALSGVDPARAGDATAIQPMVATLISGMGTALNTTLVGAIGYLHIHLTMKLAA